jgi:hypothetical protein
MDRDAQRFSEQLPFLVNGTLPPEEVTWMNAYLDKQPQARQELKFADLLRQAALREAPPTAEIERLDRFLRSYRHLREPSGPWAAVATWFNRSWNLPSYALAALTLVFAAETLLLGTLLSTTQEEERYRGKASGCPQVGDIRIKLGPETKLAEMAALLRQVRLSVIDGPSVNAEFWVRPAAVQDTQPALVDLRASPLVDEAVSIDLQSMLPACTSRR